MILRQNTPNHTTNMLHIGNYLFPQDQITRDALADAMFRSTLGTKREGSTDTQPLLVNIGYRN